MSVTTLELTAHDPIIARDGRPFGLGQGNRMRSLSWPLPSVVAGSFRTALVKAAPTLDFTKKTPLELVRAEVAGVFPTMGQELYLPSPCDCLWDEKTGKVHRVQPVPLADGDGVDFAHDLSPVRLTDAQASEDFKGKPAPAWWPQSAYAAWLTDPCMRRDSSWFTTNFLGAAERETRDHVCLDPETGAAAESLIFTTTGLNLTRLPRHGVELDDKKLSLDDRFPPVTLSARVTIAEKAFAHVERFAAWHPLGGERRLIHWRRDDAVETWKCPTSVADKLAAVPKGGGIRMVLATPAIFDHGWRPKGLDETTLTWKPLGDGPTLKLVGVCIERWRAVSGWSYAPHAEEHDGRRRVVPKDRPGPKAIRRMVPAGGVYFFERVDGDPRILASNGWLKPLSDWCYDRRDGFGLAVWGTW